MENISKLTIDDSSSSMYFSFNSTTANKTLEAIESCSEVSGAIDGDLETEQNLTLGADEYKDTVEQLQTVKKLSFAASPLKAFPKNILNSFKALSSTPTKAQLLRSVEVNRGSSAVDICDLGLAFLEAPQESIKATSSEDKENLPRESQEICSETSSETVVSVIEKTDVLKPMQKRVGFSNLPVQKRSKNINMQYTPKVRRSISRCEPDLCTNRPSRILSKRMSLSTTGTFKQTIEYTANDVPKMLTSILKLSKDMPNKKKSFANPEKPFNLIGKSTRQSIVKTTLNSPARKVSRKSSSTAIAGKNSTRLREVPNSMQKSKTSSTGIQNTRKSMIPSTITSPKKNIAQISRKSMMQEKDSAKSLIPSSRNSMVFRPITSTSSNPNNVNRKLSNGKEISNYLKDEHVCEVCSRKFRVLSLYEAHKATHKLIATTSSMQLSSADDKQCRYCDKKFAIAKALNNHLIQNCAKIPPGHKKKLLYSSSQPLLSIDQAAPKKPAKSISEPSKCEEITSTSRLDRKSESINKGFMPPPSISKLKTKSAHSGVYCTPNKQIPCHICKICFNSILDYTKHSLSHTTPVKEDSAMSTTNESTQTQVDVMNNGTQTLQVNESAVSN